jgi:septal ring factor EnvC (AmiA/AmiB activator)
MGSRHLETALKNLSSAIREVEAELEEMRAEHDPLAVHIFVSRRDYRKTRVLKSGKPQNLAARLSWQRACDLGFRSDLGEWERLMGAAPKR